MNKVFIRLLAVMNNIVLDGLRRGRKHRAGKRIHRYIQIACEGDSYNQYSQGNVAYSLPVTFES